jgi:hypothetical protein
LVSEIIKAYNKYEEENENRWLYELQK